MHSNPIITDSACEHCGHTLRIVTSPEGNRDGRTSVRCTHCPAGGDITANGRRLGPVFDGATGAQRSALNANTPQGGLTDTENQHVEEEEPATRVESRESAPRATGRWSA
jgi:hypothetical protein